MNMLDLELRTVGRPAAPLTFNIEGELDMLDLVALREPRESTAPPIKKLRERHHALARYLAMGTHPGEAGIICGYSASRVSILQGDPTFKELVAHYRGCATERYYDGHSAMSELHIDAIEELRERLEEQPEEFTQGQLMELAKLTADRTGLGVSTKTEVNLKDGLADRMAAGRRRAQALRSIPDAEIVEE